MNLIVSLTNPDILPTSLRTRRVEFGSSGGIIGRHQDCDWVLDDPERFVSSRHLSILFKNDSFYAEDISTNGTYLNEELIGKGNKLPLVTGDVLRLGRFILSVEQRDDKGGTIGDANQTAVDLLADTSHGKEGRGEDNVFASSGDLLAGPQDTDKIDEFIGDSLTASGEDTALSSEFAPLPGVQDAIAVQRQAETNEAVPSDWMTRDSLSVDPIATPSEEDLVSSDAMPSAVLDDYGLTPVPPMEEPETGFTPDPVREPKKAKSKAKTVKNKASSAVKAEKPKKTAAKKVKPKAAVVKKPVKRAANKATKKPTRTAAKIVAAPVEASVAPAPSVPPESISEDFGTALARSLMLNPTQATGETGHVLGQVMRELIEGSLDLMQTRNQMRQELRLSGTMVGARANNPLKFSINYQDALGRMLQGEAMGFKPPVESTAEVIDDLKRHQLGVLAGIDAGVQALLDALDPKKLSGGKVGIAGLSMTSKMAEHHARIKEDTVERSDGVFWRAFAEAYKMAVAQSYEN